MMTEPIAMLTRAWPDGQENLVQGLSQTRAYRHSPIRITHIQTHISHVFLTGAYAYKVKKALKLEFLDFSTLDRRRLACEEELRINRRLAPGLYLAVVPIAGTPELPSVEGNGTPIEYAVKMREFDQKDLLDRVLQRGALTASMIDAVAHQLADFHRGLGTVLPPDGCGTEAATVDSALQNFAALEARLTGDEDVELLASLRTWMMQEGARLTSEFSRRREEGYVRECHGDLHLGNIALVDGSIRIFDGIDFSATLRWIDVMNEVAFLMMDLSFRRRHDHAFRFLNQYLERTGDYEGISLLRYYLVYRAMVRAKVDILRAYQGDVTGRQRTAFTTQSRRRIQWAFNLVANRQPTMILLHGFSGSGKTTRSMSILEAIGAIRIRSDVERKRLHGLLPSTHAQDEIERGLYSESETQRTYDRLANLARMVAGAGFPVIVDATFLDRGRRDVFRQLAEELHIPFVIADFLADVNKLRDRVARRTSQGNDASDAGIAVLEQQLQHHDPLGEDELSQVLPFDTTEFTGKDYKVQARHLISATRI